MDELSTFIARASGFEREVRGLGLQGLIVSLGAFLVLVDTR